MIQKHEDEDENIVGIRLRGLRTIHGFHLRDVASSLSTRLSKTVSIASLSRYESVHRRGKRIPKMITLVELASLYGVSTDFILGRTDDESELEPLTRLKPISEIRELFQLKPKAD